ncbi:Bgt-50691 [Blumeria graminis f. sp. tritici]|uniref:Bgt-50691 n=1 Tax=Blumeria graminis f. sp. tritici TaxID=62690 RepID=A0A9X9PSP0_BLUGR|nr:Bgt-50691 [Blumeria graminis f. sp. tritici]
MASFREEIKGKKQRERITGTLKYMALELLEAIDDNDYTLKQTYRHDLESFFYVLIVGCMSYCREEAPTHLQNWYLANTTFCFKLKQSDVIYEFEKQILNYFTPTFECLQELARVFAKYSLEMNRSDTGHRKIQTCCMSL